MKLSLGCSMNKYKTDDFIDKNARMDGSYLRSLLKKNITYKKSNPKIDKLDSCIYDDESIHVFCKSNDVNLSETMVKTLVHIHIDNLDQDAKYVVDQGIDSARSYYRLSSKPIEIEIELTIKSKPYLHYPLTIVQIS